MAFIIYKDINGNEISRREKTRGRQPLGEHLPNEDIVIIDKDAIPNPKVIIPTTEITSEIVPIEVKEEEVVIKKRKSHKFPPCITLDKLLNAINPISPKRIIRNDRHIRIPGGMIVGSMERLIGGSNGKMIAELIQKSALYSMVEIDFINNKVKIWILPSSTSASRLEARKSVEGFIEQEEKQKEYDIGDLFTEPADREIEGIIIKKE